MAKAETERVALGDRVAVGLRKWLGRFALQRRMKSRSEALEAILAAGQTVDASGNDPLRILELSVALQARGVDPEKLLALKFYGRGEA